MEAGQQLGESRDSPAPDLCCKALGASASGSTREALSGTREAGLQGIPTAGKGTLFS